MHRRHYAECVVGGYFDSFSPCGSDNKQERSARDGVTKSDTTKGSLWYRAAGPNPSMLDWPGW